MTDYDDHPVDFLPELALGVLAESAAADIRAHLAGCGSCSAEYEEMALVARLLPLAAEDREPSADLKTSVMDRIAAEPSRLGSVRPAIIRPRWQWLAAAAAAAALFLVAGGAGGWALGRDGESGLEGQLVRQQSIVNAAADNTLRSIPAKGPGGVEATLLSVPGSPDAFVRMSNPPGLPAGKRYQAWYIRGDTPEPGEVFADGSGIWLHARNGNIEDYNSVGFTIEDEDGAVVPSQEPFMVIPTTQTVRAR